MNTFDQYAETLHPKPKNAQILLEVNPGKHSRDALVHVLKMAGVEVEQYDVVREGDPEWLLISLSSADMREAVLKLSEAGFNHVRGINAEVEASQTVYTKERHEREWRYEGKDK